MIYDYRPPRGNGKARTAAALLLLAALIAFVGSALVPLYPFLLQCVGLCLLIPVIQIAARYLVVQYLYRLREREDGTVDFEVFSYRGGARMQLVCRVSLAEITAAAPLNSANRAAPKDKRRYSYHPDMRPDNGLVLSVTNFDGDAEILLAPDAYLTDIFTRAAEKAVERVEKTED